MVKVLIDNCISASAKIFLEDKGFDCKWVGDFLSDPGDEAIMKLASVEQRVIATLDKDFGELAVFKGVAHYGIIRIIGFSSSRHGEIIFNTLQNYLSDIQLKSIVTVDATKVRIRTS